MVQKRICGTKGKNRKTMNQKQKTPLEKSKCSLQNAHLKSKFHFYFFIKLVLTG